MLDELALKKDASYYSYLDKSGCVRVPFIDDAFNFKTTKVCVFYYLLSSK